MRNLLINKTKHYVLNYKGKEKVSYIVEGQTRYTGEEQITYSKPIMFMGHISGARGSSQIEMFGSDVEYDKTLILTKREFDELKITENSVFFVDKNPTFDKETNTPLYDYRVSRIAETINEVAIALKKVSR